MPLTDMRGLNYNPDNSGISSVDKADGKSQFNTFYWLKKSLIDARKEQFFMPLASTIGMPKHYGKTVKVMQYVPLLDDRNVNDQGIDALGAKIDPGSGNLYGSSKDVGTILNKLPHLSENGGRVNRVGFTRLEREGSIHKFGFFYEWSKESMDFDSDPELQEHLSRELMSGAVQLTEAVLQKDLLGAAGTVIYAGGVIDDSQMTGVGDDPAVVSYEDLVRLSQTLTDNRTPKQTKVITGSRLVDTKTLPSGRVMFVGSEVVSVLKNMRDHFGNPAFVAVQHYADAGNVLNGEIGTIDEFRIIQVPEMLHWAGVGANDPTEDTGFRSSGGKFDVFPMLVVGDESFSTIGFQTDGKTVKFSVITKMPGNETADRTDPYGETGFSSIKWYYGVLIKRPERLGLIKTLAKV
jgi:N4-gp56 family major capsid protein